MNKKYLINIIISIALILSIGLITGYTIGYFQAKTASFPNIQTVGEINPGVTTIKLLEVKNGQLIGKISGRHGRIAYSQNDILELEPENEFTIPLNRINLKNFYVADTIPEGAQYIASKNGKYYYSILNKKAFNITPKNRIYFSSEGKAEQRGYLKK